MDHLFNEFIHPRIDGGNRNIIFRPAVEMEESDNAIHLKLEMPGLDIKDIDIQASENQISICGERKSKSKTKETGMMRSEFHYGKNGILSLTLPKSEVEQIKFIKVNLG